MMMAMKIVDGVLVMVVMVMTYIPSCLSKKKKKKRRGKRRGRKKKLGVNSSLSLINPPTCF